VIKQLQLINIIIIINYLLPYILRGSFMFRRINIAFSGKYNKDAGYLKLCSVIQACLIEIVFELRLEVATAPDIQVAGIHTSTITSRFIET
jgi:hypothetical protein